MRGASWRRSSAPAAPAAPVAPVALVALVVLVVLVAGCRPAPPPLGSCADALDGVWVAEADPAQRFHVLDRGRPALLVVPLWDTSRPPGGDKLAPGAPVLTPLRIELRRDGERVAGTASFRLTRDGAPSCVVSGPAGLRGCAGTRATLALPFSPTAPPLDCAGAPPSAAVDVPMRRE